MYPRSGFSGQKPVRGQQVLCAAALGHGWPGEVGPVSTAACAEPGCWVEAPRPEEANMSKRDITPGESGDRGGESRPGGEEGAAPRPLAGQGFCEDHPSSALRTGAPSLSCKRCPLISWVAVIILETLLSDPVVSHLETQASGNADDDIKGPEAVHSTFISQSTGNNPKHQSVVASETPAVCQALGGPGPGFITIECYEATRRLRALTGAQGDTPPRPSLARHTWQGLLNMSM